MSWIEKLKEKWGLKTLGQVIVVLIVFSCTGYTVLYIKTPILDFISGGGEKTWWMILLYILCIFPIYNILLLCYGFIFGQFSFFWQYELKLFRKLRLIKNVPKK